MVYKNLKRSALFHYGWPFWGCSLCCAPVFPSSVSIFNCSPSSEKWKPFSKVGVDVFQRLFCQQSFNVRALYSKRIGSKYDPSYTFLEVAYSMR